MENIENVEKRIRYSVVIPYGNAKATIRACVESVLAAADALSAVDATLGVEILCINGGSDDRTDFVVDEFAAKDSCIVPFANWPCDRGGPGPGPARNFGIERAKGEYLVFVDADDTLDADALVRLKDATADIVTSLGPDGTHDLRETAARRRLFQPLVGNLLVWNAIWRRESIGDLRFPNLMNYEDLVFTCGAFAHAKTVQTGVRPWYRHVVRPNGCSRNKGWRRVREGLVSRRLMCAALAGACDGFGMKLVLAKKMALHVLLHTLAYVPGAAGRSLRNFLSFGRRLDDA